MKFDYCVGNPPYQESKNGNNHNIWPDFLKSVASIANIRCMVHPGRWIMMSRPYEHTFDDMKTQGLRSFNYYPKSSDVFPSVGLDGGVSITYFEGNNSDKVKYFINTKDKGIFDENLKVFTDNFKEEAYSKVFKDISKDNNMNHRINESLARINGTNNYGHIKDRNLDLIFDTPDNMKNPVKIWISKTQGRGESKFMWYFVEKDNLINIDPIIYTSRKVAIDGRGNALAHGKGNGFNNIPHICERDQFAFSHILVFPEVERERDLLLIKSLFMTKTARFLMSITQTGLGVCGFENIPDYLELAKLLPEDELFTDEWFYKTFDFSEGLINEIETRVSPKVDKEV